MKKIITTFILIFLLLGCICALFACAPDNQDSPASTYIISFNTNGGNAIKSVTFKSGATLTLPDEPVREGYVFTGWYMDKECEREVNTALFRVVSNTTIFAGWESVETYRHYITFDERIDDGALKVVSPEDGRASYGTEVQVSVVPNDGYVLIDGSLKANGVALEHVSAQIYKFTMPKTSVVITCDFDLAPLPVSLLNTYENGLLVLSTDSARPGEQVSVQAIPDYGYRLTELYVLNNDLTDLSGEMKISILLSGSFYMGVKEVFVGASFEKIDFDTAYNISIAQSQGGSVVIDSNSCPAGLFVNVDFVPNDGYRLDRYIVTGASWTSFIKSDNDGFIMPSENVTISAYFNPIREDDSQYFLSVNPPKNGSVSIETPKEHYKNGEKIHLNVIPDEGYALQNLFVNGVSVIGDSFVMPPEDATITADFVKKGYNIDALCYNCNIVFSQPTAYEGDIVYFEIVEHEGYKVNPSSITLNGQKVNGNYFIMPAEDVVLSLTGYSTNVKYDVAVATLDGGTIVPSSQSANIFEKITLDVYPVDGLRLKPNSLKISYYKQGVEKIEYLSGTSFIMPDTDVVISAQFERAYKVNPLHSSIATPVSVYPSLNEIGEGEKVWFDVVAHENVISNSIKATVHFGLYTEPLNLARNFEITREKILSAGLNPEISIKIDSFTRTDANNSYPINVKNVSGGLVSVEGSSYGWYGAIVRLAIREEEGYQLESLYLTTNSGENYPISDTFVMPNSPVNIVPTFTVKDDSSFSLGSQYTRNVANFKNAGIKLEYFREKYQFTDKYPALKNHKFLNYLVGAVKVDAKVGHDFYLIEVNNVDKVNAIAHVAHLFIADQLALSVSDINVYINYNYIILSVGGNPREDFYAYKNGVALVSDYVIYEREDGTYGIYSYVGDGGYLTILDRYKERSVSYLSSNLFASPEKILGINLSNIKEIDDFALAGTAISTIDLKDVKVLGEGVFKDCRNLSAFSVSPLNDKLSVLSGVLYKKTSSKNYDSLYAYPIARSAIDDSYSIGSQTSSIESYAFYGASLKVVSYGGSLTSIGDYAFANSSLESLKYTSATAIQGVVDFSTSNVNKSVVAVLGEGAFKGCGKLNTFYLDTITSIGDEAIEWNGSTAMTINLSTKDGVGVVIVSGKPIVVPAEQSAQLRIYIPQDLKELYLANANWLKYSTYFEFV